VITSIASLNQRHTLLFNLEIFTMKKIITLVFISFTVFAQAQITRGGGGAFSLGLQNLDTESLVDFYTGSMPISSNNFSFGGYGYGQLDNWIIGFSGAGIYGFEQKDESYVYSFGGGYIAADFGYKFVNNEKWSLYPFASIGFGGVGYSIYANEEEDVTLGDSLSFNSVSYGWGNVVYGAGVRVEKYFDSKDPCGNGGLVGLELGFLTSPTDNNWTLSYGEKVNGGPDYSMRSFFVRVTFGGFGGK
jgi:hypothetical protein